MKLIAVLIFSFSVAALADAPAAPTTPVTPPAPMCPFIGGDGAGGHPYFQCSAHHTEDDFRLHYGAPTSSMDKAKDAALKACSDFENNCCEIHDCRYFLQ